jgi:hypothetical protein
MDKETKGLIRSDFIYFLKLAMGVNFYNCHICGEIYPDCGNYGSCEGCNKSWCDNCNKKHHSFLYGDDIYCDLCFGDEPESIDAEDMIDFMCTKYNTTRDAISAEMPKKELRSYECVDEEEHECHEDCPLTQESVEDPKSIWYTCYRRGRCCVAQGTECESKKKKQKV